MLTKEDYMKLSKERLAELLVEKDNQSSIVMPFTPQLGCYDPCYDPNSPCPNPQRDCINCPRRGYMGNIITTTNTTLKD